MKNIKLILLTILLSLLSFYSYTQNKDKTLISSKTLYNLLEDNFRKDTLINVLDSTVRKQEGIIASLDSLANYRLKRIEAVNQINQLLVNSNDYLKENSETLRKSVFRLDEMIDKKRKENEDLITDNEALKKKIKNKNKRIFGFVTENALLVVGTLLYLRFK